MNQGGSPSDPINFQLRASLGSSNSPDLFHSGVHHRGYLPHIKREGAWYFVTFRLADSLPAQVWIELQRQWSECTSRLKPNDRAGFQQANRELRRRLEVCLDRGIGECHLRNPAIASIVADSLRYFHGARYLLDAWTIMPNHVHILLWPMPNHTLSDILESRKRHTARQANILLGRTGKPFWQHESYDHWIRNDEEKQRIRSYIRNNPVKAKLCATPEDWPWDSAWPGWET